MDAGEFCLLFLELHACGFEAVYVLTRLSHVLCLPSLRDLQGL